MHNSVVPGTGQPRVMTPWLQTHDQGTYYSTQISLLYGFLKYIRSLPYLIQRPIIFRYPSHWDIWFHLWDYLREWKLSVLKYFWRTQFCIVTHLRINPGLLRYHTFWKCVHVLNTSMLCFITSMGTYARDLYTYSKFIQMTSALTHVLSRCHWTFFFSSQNGVWFLIYDSSLPFST